jgi:ubiquitin carboxyl-terminal hydrolase 9/24
LIGKECPHRSESEEPFYTISLDVSRQKNILESLELFVQGEEKRKKRNKKKEIK